MSAWVLIFFLDQLLAGRHRDPSPGILQTKEAARNLECVRLSQARAHELHPGEVAEPPGRRAWGERDALVCRQRYMRLGERPMRDEAVLSNLRASIAEIVQAASTVVPAGVTWHVDAFYPDAIVAAKIAVAAKTELVERGRAVSDRVPTLAAGDIAVLGRRPPMQAFPLACARYFAEKSLAESDAFLGLMILDERETQLHAGLCVRGGWRWLR